MNPYYLFVDDILLPELYIQSTAAFVAATFVEAVCGGIKRLLARFVVDPVITRAISFFSELIVDGGI